MESYGLSKKGTGVVLCADFNGDIHASIDQGVQLLFAIYFKRKQKKDIECSRTEFPVSTVWIRSGLELGVIG